MTPTTANILQPIIDVADAILRFFHDEAGFSWGAAIIGMTVVIRIAILPLTYRGIRGIQNMQRLAPEIKKIQEKHKDDKQRQQQEMMAFYQEQKVNPFSSCLPFVLQIPFFLALFQLLRSNEFKNEIRGEESFLFIPNLAEPATGDLPVLLVLIVLYVGTQLAASLVTAISADRTQRMIALGLPFLFVAFIISFETGLIVYWITTNVWTIGQQLVVKKFLPPPAPPAAAEDRDEKPAKGRAAPAKAAAATAGASGESGSRRWFGASGGDGGGDGKAPAATRAGQANGGPRKAPPPSPRKKKKRSGRRR